MEPGAELSHGRSMEGFPVLERFEERFLSEILGRLFVESLVKEERIDLFHVQLVEIAKRIQVSLQQAREIPIMRHCHAWLESIEASEYLNEGAMKT